MYNFFSINQVNIYSNHFENYWQYFFWKDAEEGLHIDK